MSLSTFIAVMKALLGFARQMPTKKHLPVLLVEDNPDEAHLIQLVLRRIGVEAVIASGPDTAAALLANGKFRMVILDIQFPQGNGLDFSDQIYNEYPDLPVLFLTGHLPEIKVGPGTVRVLGPGRVYTMSSKGVESGSLEQALRVALKISNGVNGDYKPAELFVVAWVLCSVSAGIGMVVGHFLKALKL